MNYQANVFHRTAELLPPDNTPLMLLLSDGRTTIGEYDMGTIPVNGQLKFFLTPFFKTRIGVKNTDEVIAWQVRDREEL